MTLPPRVLFSVLEVAGRWGCAPYEIIRWAAVGQIRLVTGVSMLETAEGPVAGLVELHGADLLLMTGPEGRSGETFHVRRIRLDGEKEWRTITDPDEGLALRLTGVLVLASEVQRFETEFRLLRSTPHGAAGEGPAQEAPRPLSKYDWDGMYVAVIQRIYEHGLPESQTEFIGECQEWFARRDPRAGMPDESTIRRRINPIWLALRGG